jgi:hypothetical protein
MTSVSLGQETKNLLTDLQTAGPDIFDPTRKQETEEYKFSTLWRVEGGYIQNNHRQDTSFLYLHGLRLGATVDFTLPYNLSVQTGALLSCAYGQNNQHWPSISLDNAGNSDYENAQVNILQHNIVQLQLTIPVRVYYSLTLWKKLRMFFYAGPQLQIGLTNYDLINKDNISSSTLQWIQSLNLPMESYDRYLTKELYRTNIQFGLGGGFEWDRYRLQAGYDFGLNNIIRTPITPSQKMSEWGWMLTFSYSL